MARYNMRIGLKRGITGGNANRPRLIETACAREIGGDRGLFCVPPHPSGALPVEAETFSKRFASHGDARQDASAFYGGIFMVQSCGFKAHFRLRARRPNAVFSEPRYSVRYAWVQGSSLSFKRQNRLDETPSSCEPLPSVPLFWYRIKKNNKFQP